MKSSLIFGVSFICIAFSLSAQESLEMKLMDNEVVPGAATEYNDIWGYRHGNKEFAIVGSLKSINVYDVTDCSNVTLETQWTDGNTNIWRDFKDYEDYIYASCDGASCNTGLQIMNKDDFTIRESIQTDFAKAHNIFIEKEQGRLYAVGTNTLVEGVYIYDLKEDPANPVLLNALNFDNVPDNDPGYHYVHDIYVEDNIAYCSHGTSVGMKVYDLTDPLNPIFLGQADPGNGYNHSSWKHPDADYLYVAKETRGKKVSVYDVSDPANITWNDLIRDPLLNLNSLIVHNPFVHKNRLYMSYYHDGVKVYDTTEDPSDPELAAYYDTYPTNTNYNGWYGAWGIYPFLPSGCILVSDIQGGLFTLKTTLIPESRTKMESVDIVLTDASKGIVFIDTEDTYRKISMNSDFSLNETTIETEPSNSQFKPDNSNLYFDSNSNGVILRSLDGKYARMTINSSNNLVTTYIAELPEKRIEISSDLYFKHYRSGLILKDENGDCKHITYGDSGPMEITDIDCNP